MQTVETRRWARDPVSGYSHLVGCALALVGGLWITLLAWRGAHPLAVATYAACSTALYAASSAYHLVDVGEAVTARLRRLDHAAIFLMIAGTATPLLAHALSGPGRTRMLVVVWGVAIVGALFRTLWLGAPRWLYTTAYVAAGWVVLFQWKAVVAGTPALVLAFVVAGGVVYTAGAAVYVSKWPDPRPGRFGFHEIWHLFVLAASTLHFVAVAALV